MAIYASYLKMTAAGNKEIKKSRERFEQGKRGVEKLGGKILDAYYIVSKGEYLIISEFPDHDARVKSMVHTLQEGNVSYEVFRMLPIEEYFKLVDSA
ncbi:MAG: GYD domain-containing protein [Desulfobacterales bacterium]